MGCNGVFMRLEGIYDDFVVGYQENGYILQSHFKLEGNKWTYVLFTYTSSVGLDLYTNGVKLMLAQNHTILNYTASGSCPTTVLLAGTNYPSSGANAVGAIDEFAFWDQSLNQSFITAGINYYKSSQIIQLFFLE